MSIISSSLLWGQDACGRGHRDGRGGAKRGIKERGRGMDDKCWVVLCTIKNEQKGMTYSDGNPTREGKTIDVIASDLKLLYSVSMTE